MKIPIYRQTETITPGRPSQPPSADAFGAAQGRATIALGRSIEHATSEIGAGINIGQEKADTTDAALKLANFEGENQRTIAELMANTPPEKAPEAMQSHLDDLDRKIPTFLQSIPQSKQGQAQVHIASLRNQSYAHLYTWSQREYRAGLSAQLDQLTGSLAAIYREHPESDPDLAMARARIEGALRDAPIQPWIKTEMLKSAYDKLYLSAMEAQKDLGNPDAVNRLRQQHRTLTVPLGLSEGGPGVSNRPARAFQFFRDKFKSAGFKPEQAEIAAAAFVGNKMQESGPNLDPTMEHDNRIGIGIAGWNKERRIALQALAKERKTTETDFETQLEYTWRELQTTEKATFEALKKAQTVDTATQIAQGFFRPGIPHTDARIKNANVVYNSLSGGRADTLASGGFDPQFFASRGNPSLKNVDPVFGATLQRALAEAEQATGEKAKITELARSSATQAQYRANYTGKPIYWQGVTFYPQGKGGLAAAPGSGRHEYEQGPVTAADLGAGKVRDYIRANATRLGLETISDDEPHIQLAGGGGMGRTRIASSAGGLGYRPGGKTSLGVSADYEFERKADALAEQAKREAQDLGNKLKTQFDAQVESSLSQVKNSGTTGPQAGRMMTEQAFLGRFADPIQAQSEYRVYQAKWFAAQDYYTAMGNAENMGPFALDQAVRSLKPATGGTNTLDFKIRQDNYEAAREKAEALKKEYHADPAKMAHNDPRVIAILDDKKFSIQNPADQQRLAEMVLQVQRERGGGDAFASRPMPNAWMDAIGLNTLRNILDPREQIGAVREWIDKVHTIYGDKLAPMVLEQALDMTGKMDSTYRNTVFGQFRKHLNAERDALMPHDPIGISGPAEKAIAEANHSYFSLSGFFPKSVDWITEVSKLIGEGYGKGTGMIPMTIPMQSPTGDEIQVGVNDFYKVGTDPIKYQNDIDSRYGPGSTDWLQGLLMSTPQGTNEKTGQTISTQETLGKSFAAPKVDYAAQALAAYEKVKGKPETPAIAPAPAPLGPQGPPELQMAAEKALHPPAPATPAPSPLPALSPMSIASMQPIISDHPQTFGFTRDETGRINGLNALGKNWSLMRDDSGRITGVQAK